MCRENQRPQGHRRHPPRRDLEVAGRSSASPARRRLYHFAEIRTPIFEHTELFHRGVGETTRHRQQGNLHLQRPRRPLDHAAPRGHRRRRPRGHRERAAERPGRARQGLLHRPELPLRAPAEGPPAPAPPVRRRSVRRRRARAGRRVHPAADGLLPPLRRRRTWRCGSNSLGDRESKQRYRDALVAYLSPKQTQLSEDSQRRLTTNPLRILDSKDPRDIEAVQGAPPAIESLSDKSRKHFERVPSAARGGGRPVHGRRHARPRLRLLHRHALGSHRRRPRRTERHRRRRPLRQPRRKTRRPAHARRRLRQRPRAPAHRAGRPGRRTPPRRGQPRLARQPRRRRPRRQLEAHARAAERRHRRRHGPCRPQRQVAVQARQPRRAPPGASPSAKPSWQRARSS